MENTENDRKSQGWQKRQLVLAVVTAAVVAVVMGTLAWMSYERALFTVTTMQMPILFLRDENEENLQPRNSAELPLGSLDLREPGSARCIFGVHATKDTEYLLQLGYTKNLKLEYHIYPATRNWASTETEVVDRFTAGTSPIGMKKLTDTMAVTYGDYASVQAGAQTEYQQSETAEPIGKGETDFYVLEVQWTEVQHNDKETEMIYITAATALTPAATQPTEATQSTGGNG